MFYQSRLATTFFAVLLTTITTQSQASMLGLCNDAKYTQYICCPANGGWIVSDTCNPGASPYCTNDTGLISGSNPTVTILQDCKNKGGTQMSYYLNGLKRK